MEDREQRPSPTKPKWPFKSKVWFKTSMLEKRRVPVEPMKRKCRHMLQVAQGRVIAENPDIDTATKKRLIDLSEQILSGLDRGLQLQVLDPEKLPKLVKKNRPLLNQVRRKNEEFEDMIKKAEALRDQLKQQFKPENGDASTVKVSSEGSDASEGPDPPDNVN